MLLWEMVFEADQEHDLADLEHAVEVWINKQPWGGLQQDQPERFVLEWKLAVWALRSLVRRLKGRRPRHRGWEGGKEDEAADEVAATYIRMLRPTPVGTPYKPGRDRPQTERPWTARTFRGVKLLPSWEPDPAGHPGFIASADLPRVWTADSGHFLWQAGGAIFWQLVFLSLLGEDSPRFCEGCGRWIGDGRTPKGRTSRLRFCGSCRVRAHMREKTPAERRAIWRRNDRRRFGKGE
jgi:hypothetical protein